MFAAAYEELRVEVGGEVVELETDGAGREKHLFSSAGHAGEFHDGKEELKLTELHNVSVT
jgi:hypothetical protein